MPANYWQPFEDAWLAVCMLGLCCLPGRGKGGGGTATAWPDHGLSGATTARLSNAKVFVCKCCIMESKRFIWYSVLELCNNSHMTTAKKVVHRSLPTATTSVLGRNQSSSPRP